GPLTLVVRARYGISRALTAGSTGIGLRWPDAPFATRLVAGVDVPITATSANRSGMPSASTAAEVRSQLEDRLEMLVDGGTLPFPGGSSVLDLNATTPVLLREGPVSFEALSEALEGNIRR